MKNSRTYHTWLYYADQTHENVPAYVVEITGGSNGKLIGSLYCLNYEMHCRHVEDAALRVDHIKIIYEHGERIVQACQCILYTKTSSWERLYILKNIQKILTFLKDFCRKKEPGGIC